MVPYPILRGDLAQVQVAVSIRVEAAVLLVPQGDEFAQFGVVVDAGHEAPIVGVVPGRQKLAEKAVHDALVL